MPNGRTLERREPIEPRTSGNVADGSRSINGSRNPIQNRNVTGRTVTDVRDETVAPSQEYFANINQMIAANIGKYISFPWSNVQTSTTPSEPSGTFYGTDDPFLVLSDVFRNVFGGSGDVGQRTQTGQALVPVTSSSGSGNIGMLLLVLVAVGIGGWYLYKKYKG